MELKHADLPNYVAAWNMHTKRWSIKYAPDLMNANTHRKVIDIPQLDQNGSDIRASFRSADPTLDDDSAASAAAHAILRFFWPDEEEEGDVRSIQLVHADTGRQYDFTVS